MRECRRMIGRLICWGGRSLDDDVSTIQVDSSLDMLTLVDVGEARLACRRKQINVISSDAFYQSLHADMKHWVAWH